MFWMADTPKAVHAELYKRRDERLHLTLNVDEAWSMLRVVQFFCKRGAADNQPEHVQTFNQNLLTKLEDLVCTTPAITEFVWLEWPERKRNEHQHHPHRRKRRQFK